MPPIQSHPAPWRRRLFDVIFEADSPAGKAFDLGLILSIVLSVIAVMLDSVAAIRAEYGAWLRGAEWFFTVAFTIEYILRMISVRHPSRYAFSFYGLVDLLAVLPTYIAVLFPGLHYLLVIRALRILRVFRVLKLVLYLREGNMIARALLASRRKITVFLFAVLTLVVIIGSVMYLVEGPVNGFTSIPTSIYWTIVTLTTVGYGDIAPQTVLGKLLASVVMILGYAIIAVPTGIVTAEMAQAGRDAVVVAGEEGAKDVGHTKQGEIAGALGSPTTDAEETEIRICAECGAEGHAEDARYCRVCGSRV